MGVAGGAVFTPIQGAVADHKSTRISMVIPLIGFLYVFGYVTYHWVTHGFNIIRVKDVVVAADTAGRRGSAWGGAVGGAVNYVHYTAEKEVDADSTNAGARRASVVSHGRKQSIAVGVRRPSVAGGAHVQEPEQKGNPILL
jgi:FHS family L-fucose permease-like MFS transporter